MGITIVMAVYGQPLMLEKWFNTICDYPEDVLDNLSFVIVDDHGTPPVKVPEAIQSNCDIRVYRVDKDIPWNQMGARNLGMQKARTPWCLMLDPDMVVEPVVMERLLKSVKTMERGQVCKLLLRYTNDVLDASSPNAWLIHKRDFDVVGGYDEDYAGHKGWSDVQLMHTISGCGFRFLKDETLWVRYYRPRDIKDSTVNTLSRNTKHNKALHLRKMAIAKRSWTKWMKRDQKRVQFPWTRVV